MKALPVGTPVKVRSGEILFEGIVDETAWDFDQFAYKVKGAWYCQSEVTFTCKHIHREGESCALNNNCTYPNCSK